MRRFSSAVIVALVVGIGPAGAQTRVDVHPGKVVIQSTAADALSVLGGVTIATGKTVVVGANTLISSDKLQAAQLSGTITSATQDLITRLGTIASGTWNGTAVAAAYGGTGQGSYTTGDLLYASGASALSKLSAVATGQVLVSGGTGTAPAWSATPTLTDLTLGNDLLLASGSILNFNSGDVTLTHSANTLALGGGVFALPDGTAAAPSFARSENPDTGLYFVGNNLRYVVDSTTVYQFVDSGAFQINTNGGSLSIGSSQDVVLARDAANILALKNGTTAQAFRPYGYSSGARAGYGAVQTATASVTLTGASTATGNIIPAGAFVVGVATTTTTAITGASGYTVGDGVDADRYGDVTGTAVGTKTDNTAATANPTGYNAAASAITLTAKTSSFTAGVVQVVVFYLTTGAS